MNRVFKNLIVIFIVVCTISNISFAAIERPADAKGTVFGAGTLDNPFRLTMGEGIIDIYYDEWSYENNGEIYFEFTDGSVDAGNYLVDHSADKNRIRLTLIGTDEASRRVTSQTGLNYLQAGGINYLSVTSSDDEENILNTVTGIAHSDIQSTFYQITAEESYDATLVVHNKKVYTPNKSSESVSAPKNVLVKRNVDLANGYLNNSLIGNVSTYSTSYVFSKSNLAYNTAYELSSEQLAKINKIRINYGNIGSLGFSGDEINVVYKTEYGNTGKDAAYTEIINTVYTLKDPVKVVYKFSGTNSSTLELQGETKNPVELIISKVFTAIGDVFIKLAKLGGFGGDYYVTIDSLVFNEYPNTIVDFFGDIGYTNKTAKEIINFWYKFFQAWAVIIYIILLVFIGIKTILAAGTSKQTEVKGMFEGWIQGLLLLFLIPFFFKYLIDINDVLVDIIRVNSNYSVYAYYTFEDYYSTFGGQEDGEDSTTSVLERLQNAKAYLTLKVDEIDQNIVNFSDVKDEILQKQEDAAKKKEEGESIAKNEKESIINVMNNYNYRFINSTTGLDVSPDVVEAELDEMVRQYYEENREQFVVNENYGYDEIYNKIEEYTNQYTFINENGDYVGNANLGLVSMGRAIVSYYANDILIGVYEKDIAEFEKQEQEYVKQIASVEKAIEMAESNDADIMGIMRTKAGETSRFFYVAVWFILIFQVVLLLFLYYKRLFMIMVLIAIFPLVTVAYAYEKSKGGEASILKNWMQEFIINVFIQTIHAILYVTLVETGYAVFVANNDNWIIFIIAVIALISVEPVFKTLIGFRGSTVSDLSRYAATAGQALVAAGAVSSTFIHTGRDISNIDSNAKNKEAKIEGKQKKNDDRQAILRKANENRINKNSNLSDEEKKRKIENWQKFDNSVDKAKSGVRKVSATTRRMQRNARITARIAANSTAAIGTVAGGIAAGGDLSDFSTASAVANTITGTGKQEVKLSSEAEKKEQERLNEKNKVGNIETPGTTNREINYGGPGYDDYYGGTTGTKEVTSSGAKTEQTNSSVNNNRARSNSNFVNEMRRRLVPTKRDQLARRLADEKVYYNTNYNEQIENKDEE